MRYFLLMIAAVALVGCGESAEERAAKAKAAAEAKVVADAKAIEATIRLQLKKPTGELTKADLEKVTELQLDSNQLTELLKGLEKLAQLKWVNLRDNPELTKAKIDQLQKKLPKCQISSNSTN